jgi:YD repeat-containing protein
MMTRLLTALFLLASLTLLVSSAAAQAPGSRCSSDITPIGPFPRIPGMNCWTQGTTGEVGLTYCKVRPASCPSDNAPRQTRCLWCEAHGGLPISFGDGNTFITQSDLALPGIGGGLSLSRVWNSTWPSDLTAFQMGIFGMNWRSTYEERVFVADDGGIKYSRADGSFWSFGSLSSGTAQISAPANEGVGIATTDQQCDSWGTTCWPTHWRITFKNGEQRLFDMNNEYLISITDRNGNVTRLTYDAQNRLSTVTDPAGRTVTFSYPNTNASLVSSVTSVAGTVTYTYNGNLLSKVTHPDGTFVTFEYGANNLITAVKDTDGKVLEAHTYDELCRGLTSSRANGIESITVTYPQDDSRWSVPGSTSSLLDGSGRTVQYRNCQPYIVAGGSY